MNAATAYQNIAERAYTIWEAEGRPDGRAFEHWLQAEAEMTAPPKQKSRRAPTKARARKT